MPHPDQNELSMVSRMPAGRAGGSKQVGRPPSTAHGRVIPGEPQDGGYRRLVLEAGEQHLVRTELTGGSPPTGWQRSATPLLVLAHLSDTHVMDHQSPGRAELVDRFSDPDSPLRPGMPPTTAS